MDFLTNLEQLMDASKMNRSDVARACGLSTSTVNSWWNRSCENISMQTLIKLTKCFNCTLEELVHGTRAVDDYEHGLVYTSSEYSQEELKLISMYANFLKHIRGRGVTNDD